MQKNFMGGEIYKGSNAQLTVELFPRCYEIGEVISDVALIFYTTVGGDAVVFSGDSVTVSGTCATVVFEPVQLDVLDDGLLRYHVNLTMDGNPKVFNLDTQWIIKTPLDYEPVDYVTHDEVDNVVDNYLDWVMADYYTSAQTNSAIETAMAQETARTESTYLKEHQSLADYYTSAQTNSAITTTIQSQSATTSAQTEELITEAMAAETARTEQTYLKEHQSLANYYTSAQTNSAIETAMAQETARTENTYLKEHQSLADYYTSAQTNSAITTAIQSQSATTSAQTEELITEAMAAETARTEQTYLKEHQSLADYYTSAQTNSAITTAVQDKVSSTTIAQIWTGTQAQYDAMSAHTNNILYFING